LGVIRADDLEHAIAIQNDSDFGLTGGIHSLDPDEIERWVDRVEVGNAYVNRHITGAVVQRQPFGGWKRSSVGPGTKAGGPSYVLQFARVEGGDDRSDDEVRRSYRAEWEGWFAIDHDPSGLRAESNILRHRPAARVVARHDGTRPDLLERLRFAAEVTGVRLVESDARTQRADDLVAALRPGDRVRVIGEVDPELVRSLVERRTWLDTAAPSPHGRVELVRWVREQAISRTLHRHGRLPG
jgi:RHH-type proline utilization regulon transcriptional repressor/proline dehydrogenase/delta 1-pyrroline-5-carboxylate dehydrogenase